MAKWIDNKTVIITGASSGIGKMLAERLMKEHNCTVIGVARSEKKMLNFVEELGDYAKLFSYKLFDVSSYDNWQNFHDYLVENNIKPDVLINNAGVLDNGLKAIDSFTDEDMNKVIDINTKFLCIETVKCMFGINDGCYTTHLLCLSNIVGMHNDANLINTLSLLKCIDRML